MKPFDEEDAKRGEKVEWNSLAGWISVFYVGRESDGWLVFEIIKSKSLIRLMDASNLRMAEKKKVTKWAVVPLSAIRDNYADANAVVGQMSGYCVLPVEVEE